MYIYSIYIYILYIYCVYIYSKTSLNRATTGLTLNGPFKEVIGLGTLWDPNEAIDIRMWSICGGGQLERFYCIYMYIYISRTKENCHLLLSRWALGISTIWY